jgi:SAM-dependent methyltransferase
MTQRVSEWLETPKLDYHARQLAGVYRSTVHFCDWIEKMGYIHPSSRQTILDLGCGLGANLEYMGKRYPGCKFIGVDLNSDFVRKGNSILFDRRVDNCRIEYGDWLNLDNSYKSVFDGVISFQTISWFPDFREPLIAACNLEPKWTAHTSLFYDGPVSCTNETHTHDEEGNIKRNLFYNVYSLPVVEKFLRGNGYRNFKAAPFEIDVDLPNTGEFRSYTERTVDGRRIQISGPVFMPWYFIAAERGVA